MADGTGQEHVPQVMKFYIAPGTAAVTATPSLLLATSDGTGGLSIVDEEIMWREQGIVDRKIETVGRDVTFNLEGLTFISTNLAKFFGVTASATATMRTVGAETATAHRILGTTTKQYFGFLIQYTDSDLAKPIQWYSSRNQISGGLELSFDRTAWNQHALTIKAFDDADGGGTILEQLTQTGA